MLLRFREGTLSYFSFKGTELKNISFCVWHSHIGPNIICLYECLWLFSFVERYCQSGRCHTTEIPSWASRGQVHQAQFAVSCRRWVDLTMSNTSDPTLPYLNYLLISFSNRSSSFLYHLLLPLCGCCFFCFYLAVVNQALSLALFLSLDPLKTHYMLVLQTHWLMTNQPWAEKEAWRMSVWSKEEAPRR